MTRRAISAGPYAKASAPAKIHDIGHVSAIDVKSRSIGHVTGNDVMRLVNTSLTAGAGRPAVRGRVVGRAARSSASSEAGPDQV